MSKIRPKGSINFLKKILEPKTIGSFKFLIKLELIRGLNSIVGKPLITGDFEY
jgi:hypothetical protein